MTASFRGRDLVDRRLRRRQTEDYFQRLQNVKPHLDITPPREYHHLQLSVKKIQMQEERQAAIDRQNQVILTQLMKIKQSPARVDNWNKDWKPTNDRLKSFRERKQRVIQQENEKRAQRLKNIQPYYSTGDWEKDFKKHQYYLRLLDGGTIDEDSEESDEDEEKDELPSVSPSPEAGKKAKTKKEEQVKLPPINGNKKGRDGGKRKDEYPDYILIMDAEEIHRAIGENDKQNILQTLGRVSEKEKLDKLRQKYKELYDKDIMEDVKPCLDEKLQQMLDCLGSGAEEDATKLYEAMKGLGTDEDILIEILCTRTNAELKEIRSAYSRKYENSLEEDLKNDTSGELETLFLELCKGQRDESTEIDKELAKTDAKKLTEAGVESWGTDEGTFIRIFTQRSRPQLAVTFPEYKKLTSKDIADSIDSEMDGDLQTVFLTLVKCVRNPTGFHSDKLHKALEEGDAKTVARIILNKNKAQLDELFATYKKSYKVDLAEDIDKKCGGDMKTLTLAKLGRGKEKRKQQKQPSPEKQEKMNSKKEATKEKPKPKQEKGKSDKSYQEKDKETKEATVQNEPVDQHKVIKDKKSSQKAPASNDKTKGKPVTQTSKKPEKAAAKANEENEELDIDKDVDELHKAIEAGDKANIVNVLARHCDEKPKLKTLKEKYKEKHDQELLESIQPKLDEDLQDPVESLLMSGAMYDAKSLYNSMKGLGTDEDVLIEILCARSNAELAEIREAYTTNYGTSLEKDIKGDTSGDFEDLLVELAKGKRDESVTKVDKGLAEKDAEALLQAGYLGTDENKFIEVFTQRSLPHLKVVFTEYKKVAKAEMDECIEEEMSHDLERGFLALVKFIRDPSRFYADKLRKALNDGDTVTAGRIILTSPKDELADIIAGYKKCHGQYLAKDADAKFGEHMKKLVMAKLKKANQELKEKEKATSESNGKKAAASKQSITRGKQGGSATRKTKSVIKKQPSKREQQKKIDEPDNRDFSEIRKAIDAGDKQKIKDIICRNLGDKGRAKKLVDDYNARYGKELLEALDGKLEEELIEATAALSRSKAQYDARSLHQAMKGLGMKEVVLIETFATRTNSEIGAIRQAYKKQYSKHLEQDIRDETSGDFETLLVELSKGQRDESAEVNDDLAHKDAETLLEAGIKKWGTDEEKFIEIFTTRSFPQLRAMLPEYKRWAKCEIEETIDSEMSGNLRDGLNSLVACVRDQNKFLANKLHASFQGKSLVDSTRIILGLKESELSEVQKIYNLTFETKLVTEVEKKCSNELKKVLLAKLKDAESQKESSKDAAEKPNAQAQPTRKPSEKSGNPPELAGDEITPAEDNPAKPVDSQVEESGLKQDSDEKKEDKKENRPKIRRKKTEYQGTLGPAENFNAADDAAKLKNAMKGLGTDEDMIIAILGARSRKQRQEIAAVFQKEFNKNLVDELKSELSGNFEEAMVALMSPPEMYDANSLHEAMSDLGTNESVVVEILCSRSFEEIQAIRRVYKQVHGKDLIEEVKDKATGDLQITLISLAEGKRDTTEEVDEDLAYNDVTQILEAGENKWGTEESIVVKILTTRSLTQLQATFEAYKHVAKTDIMDSVNKELTGDLHCVIEAIVRCTRNPPLFFADVLEKELRGLTADSKAVTRVVVTRAEIDLANIKAEYARRTGEPLKVAIESRLKGDLKRILLQIVGE